MNTAVENHKNKYSGEEKKLTEDFLKHEINTDFIKTSSKPEGTNIFFFFLNSIY